MSKILTVGKFFSVFIFCVCAACIGKHKKNGSATSSEDSPSESNAEQIIRYTNSVVDLCNGYQDYLTSTDDYMQRCEKGLKASKKDVFTFMGITPQSFSYMRTINEADPSQPTSALSKDDRDFFKLHVTDIQSFYKKLTNFNDRMDKYLKAEDYKDDKGARGFAIADSSYALIDTIEVLRTMLYDKIDIVADESEKILLEKNPLKDNVLAMKEDMNLSKKLISILITQSKNITAAMPAIDSIYAKIEANGNTHKTINPDELKKENKDYSYKNFYERFDDFIIEARKTIRDIKETQTVTQNQVEELKSKSESLTSSYNAYTK